MEVGEQELAFLDEGVFGLDGFLDFHNHLGDCVGFLDGGEDGGSGVDVVLVGESAALAGGVLDVDFVALADEFLDARGGHADAVFVVFDFFGYADNHNG